MLGKTPEVLRHQGRIDSSKHQPVTDNVDDDDDGSLSGFSLLPGDVSVVVAHDLKRS